MKVLYVFWCWHCQESLTPREAVSHDNRRHLLIEDRIVIWEAGE